MVDVNEVVQKMREVGYRVAAYQPHYDPNPTGYCYVMFGRETQPKFHNQTNVNRKLARIGLRILNLYHDAVAAVEVIDDENNFTNTIARLREEWEAKNR